MLRVGVCESPDQLPHTEFYAGVLIPGVVNTHCHLELSYLRGAIPAGEGFAAFARRMGEVRGRFSDEAREEALRRCDRQMWLEGVQAVGDIANGATTFACKAQSPIRYHTFAECFGLRTRDTDHLSPLLQYPHTSLTPHSLYSVQDALFRQIARQGEAPLSIHFLESPAEKALYRGEGSLWQWYQKVGFACDFLHYGSPTRRLVESVPADRSVILVHNCCLTEEDVDRVMSHFTAPLWWALCPRSNDYISHLKPPTDLLRQKGAQITLGTDSLASNWGLSMLEELRMFPEVPLEERLRWATENGARALGLYDHLGSVEPGKRPGLLLLEGVDLARMDLTPQTSLRRLI